MSGYRDVAREIVTITNRSADTLTITRAQEGSYAQQFEVGDQLDVDFTAASLDDLLELKGRVMSYPNMMPNLKYVAGVGANLATGTTDLYTVPTAKAAIVMPQFRYYNSSAGNITFSIQLKVSSTYYRLMSDVVPGTGASGVATINQPILLNAGESISIVTATNAGLNVRFNIVEFDAADTHIVGMRVLSLASGNNTIYTVPAGKTLAPFAPASATTSMVTMLPGAVQILNTNAGTVTYTGYVVPSGGSAGTSNIIQPAAAINTLNPANMAGLVPTLNAGDFIVVNSNTASGGIAWSIGVLL